MLNCWPFIEMMPSFRRISWLLLALGISPGFLATLSAENAAPVPVSSPGMVKAKVSQMPPLPPMPKSPVDSFRELLAMKPAEREQFLATRPPEIRKRFLAKIHEYEAMKPEERELRLRATQLRWYLLPLMQTPATNRLVQLAAIPDADRELVKERLEQWDLVPSAQQKEFLEYGLTSSYFVGQDADRSDPVRKVPLEKMLPAELIKRIDYVSKLPPEQRRQMYEGFQHFFELTDADRQKTLDVLSAPERQEMQKTLVAFMRLPKNLREECLRSFGEFANMTDEERRGFFRNAERWKEMPPAERQAWRNLVNRFPPLPQMRPPMPPGLRPAVHTAMPVATNQSP
jgi:hypothetical protein